MLGHLRTPLTHKDIKVLEYQGDQESRYGNRQERELS